MRLRGKEKSNEINIDVDMKRTCHTYRHSFTMISKKEKCSMQITLTKEQVREAFGELRYKGADYCYKYDK